MDNNNSDLIIEKMKVKTIIKGMIASNDLLVIEMNNWLQLKDSLNEKAIEDWHKDMINIIERNKKKFRGTKLIETEIKVIKELEQIIGQKIPLVNEINWDIFGFTISNGRITGLGLCNKGLKSLPETIGKLIYLKVLYLYENELMSLPETIGNLKNLQKLWLYNNQLSSLPETIGNLKNLQELSLDGNQLSSLPETFRKLTNLQILDLYNNQLSSLPESIGNLKNLQELSLDGNHLSTLPETIGNLKKLQKLWLHNNQLSSLPETIRNLKNLQDLRLHYNKLLTLPKTLEQWLGDLKKKDCIIYR